MQKQDLHLQGVLEAILSESDFTVIYLKNKKCTKKRKCFHRNQFHSIILCHLFNYPEEQTITESI